MGGEFFSFFLVLRGLIGGEGGDFGKGEGGEGGKGKGRKANVGVGEV